MAMLPWFRCASALLCFSIFICMSTTNAMMTGGIGPLRNADGRIQQLVEKVRGTSEEQAGTKFPQYTAVSYKSQLVAGTNYFVKVQVSDSEYIHVRIFEPLPHVNGLPQLSAQQTQKTKDDPITYF